MSVNVGHEELDEHSNVGAAFARVDDHREQTASAESLRR
jgi:hypothetical protein